MTLNEQLYNELKPFEHQLRSAYFGHYLSCMTTEKTLQLIEIARKAHYNRQITASCSMCRLRLCTDLGEAYFNYEKQPELDEQQIELDEQQIEDGQTEEQHTETEEEEKLTETPLKSPETEPVEQLPTKTKKAQQKAKKVVKKTNNKTKK